MRDNPSMVTPAPPTHVPGELLVRLRPQTTLSREQSDLLEPLGTVIERYPLGGQAVPQESFTSSEILHLRLDDRSPQALLAARERLANDPRVAYAVTNDVLQDYQQRQPNDLRPEQYGPSAISAPQAWAERTGDRQRAPLIAVIDSGIDLTHPDLAANLWTNPGEIPHNGIDDDGNGVVDDVHGFRASQRSGDPSDDSGHGTHVAGTVGAVGDNGQGVVGVAWQANLMAVKFLEKGYGDMADAIAAITYADQQGARVTQNSWGGSVYNAALRDALAASPALHICAAGNSGQNSDVQPAYPAAYPLPNIVSVAATDSADQLASFSNFGLGAVDLAAPGVGILSTTPQGTVGVKSGTSMAAPHVSGAVSLILEKFPHLSNAELKDRLLYSVDRLPQLESKVASGGRLNLARTLEDDTVAPGRPEGLRGRALDAESLALQWVASGDDGAQGQAAAYELFVSEQPLEEVDLSTLQPLRLPPPAGAGEAESFAVDLLPSSRERTMHLALRAVDNVGQRSALAATTVTVPAAPVAFEDGPEQWTAEGQWGQELVVGRGTVWSDSPGGDYGLNQNASLTSRRFSLAEFGSAELRFDARHDLEIHFDKVFLEARVGGEESAPWSPLQSFNLLEGWRTHRVDLSALAGQDQVQLRFRLQTDGDVCKDGFSFDRLVVTGSPRSGSHRAPC